MVDSVLVHDETEDFRNLLKVLGEVEEFYDCIGRIIGIMVLELLAHNSLQIQSTVHESMEYHFLEIHPPTGYLGGEMYPLGGSADRLSLVDSGTGGRLPGAMLPYCGRILLEGLIRDLQAEFPANTNILYVDLPSAELVGLARSERTYLE
ncbi:hypothetical protein V6N13_000138 [Hibiscus sabdariffa]